MSLKWLNLDRIRPIAGRPQSSALVCSADNKSSLVCKFPIRSRLISRTAGVWLATFLPLRLITSSKWPVTSEFSENGISRRKYPGAGSRSGAHDERITVAVDAGIAA